MRFTFFFGVKSSTSSHSSSLFSSTLAGCAGSVAFVVASVVGVAAALGVGVEVVAGVATGIGVTSEVDIEVMT